MSTVANPERAPLLVRARAPQELVAGLEEFESGLERRVRRRTGPAPFEVIARADPTRWIPVRVSSHVVCAAVEELGEDRAPKLWRHFFAQRFARSPLMRVLVGGTIRMTGVTPRGLLKHIGRILQGTYRNLGTPRVELGPERRAIILLEDVHPEFLEFPRYFHAFSGSMEGICELTGHDGHASFHFDPRALRVRFEVVW